MGKMIGTVYWSGLFQQRAAIVLSYHGGCALWYFHDGLWLEYARRESTGEMEELLEEDRCPRKKLRIEAGKLYKTRKGRRVLISAILANDWTNDAPHAVGFLEGDPDAFAWTLRGRRVTESPGCVSEIDLVEEIRE